MGYKVNYKGSVSKDLRRINKKIVLKILNGIDKKISKNPNSGKALTGEFRGLFKMRFGDYRVVYTIIKNEVIIARIRHRKEVYRS